MAKSILQLFQEFEELGYVLHECPDCGEETNPTEPDSNSAFCEVCNKYIKVKSII